MSEREIAAYVVNKFLKDLEMKMFDPEFFDNEEFQEFMGRSYPNYKLTGPRKEKLLDHLGKLMERARRPIKTTLISYGYEDK